MEEHYEHGSDPTLAEMLANRFKGIIDHDWNCASDRRLRASITGLKANPEASAIQEEMRNYFGAYGFFQVSEDNTLLFQNSSGEQRHAAYVFHRQDNQLVVIAASA